MKYLIANSGAQWNENRILVWWENKELSIWNANTGKREVVFSKIPGHRFEILELKDGRILTWSKWIHKEEPLLILNPRTGAASDTILFETKGTMELKDGCVVSWSHELRVWDPSTRNGWLLYKDDAQHPLLFDGAISLGNGHIAT